ncbi:hypothetical protein [Micromonospora sp. NPDC049891]|uniref:hypothetical protein n=1 Tax=Micromonospora sp. NPDC049891 TaxID=3155655 RepID=UPI0033E9C44E
MTQLRGACGRSRHDHSRCCWTSAPTENREPARPHRTPNLLDLPARRQYGMYRLAGSGLGGWRELAANQIVTAGILAG